MTKTSSLNSAASSIEWVTIITVIDFLIRETNSIDIISIKLSKAANGSSKSSNFGSNRIALAITAL